MKLSRVGNTLFLISFISTSRALPPIQAWLTTPWKSPPILPQIAEFINRDNTTAFFSFLSALSESNVVCNAPNHTDQHVYKTVIDLLKQYEQSLLSGPMAIPLLKMSLSLHEFAPAVQAHFQFYESTVVEEISAFTECGNWVDWYGSQYCDIRGLFSELEKSAHLQPRKFLAIDHVYTAVGNHGKQLPTAIFYADLTSKEFLSWHSLLVQKADEGQITYLLRYRPPVLDHRQNTLYLSGYGVELAVKSTEYLATDDRKIDSNHDQTVFSADGVSRVTKGDSDDILFDAHPVIQSLTTEQITDLPLKTAQYVLTSSDSFSALQRVSQDFPRYAHLIAATSLHPRFQNGTSLNPQTQDDGMAMVDAEQQLNSGLYLNGLELDPVSINAFKLLRMLRLEHKFVSSLVSLGLTPNMAIDLLTTVGASKTEDEVTLGQMFDTRSDSVFWWNDLELDTRYQRRFGNSIHELLRPTFPGQMRFIRKNLVSTIYAVNLALPEHARMVLESLSFIDRDIPIRIGVIPLFEGSDDASTLIAELMLYTLNHHGGKGGKSFLQLLLPELSKNLKPQELKNEIKNIWTRQYSGISLETVRSDETVVKHMDLIKEFVNRLDISQNVGALFVNGVFLDTDEGYAQKMVQVYFLHIEYMVKKVFLSEIDDETIVYDYLMNLPHVNARRNRYIFTSESFPLKMVDLIQADDYAVVDQLKYIYSSFSKSVAPISLWIVGDLRTNHSAQIALNSIRSLKSVDGVRIAFLHNPSSNNSIVAPELPAILSLQDDSISMEEIQSHLHSILEGKGLSLAKPIKEIDVNTLKKLTSFINDGLAVSTGGVTIIANGRVIESMSETTMLNSSDFELLVNFERRERANSLWMKLQSSNIISSWSNSYSANIMLKVESVVITSAAEITASGISSTDRGRVPGLVARNPSSHMSFTNNANPSEAFFKFLIILDPASHTAQKISAIINVLKDMERTHVEVRFATAPALTKIPVSRFYRYALAAEPSFDEAGNLEPSYIRFDNMPLEPLLTLGHDVPNAWLVSAISCVHDLDNIKLSKLDAASSAKGVEGIFELKYILVEGHARELVSNQPPRGLQFILGTPNQPAMVDTITMSNLGYLQLKAFPGVLDLRIRSGRSRDIFEMVSAADSSQPRRILAADALLGSEGSKIAVTNFEGVTLFPIVRRRPGMDDQDVLLPNEAETAEGTADSSLWKSIKGSLSRGKKTLAKNPTTIHIFSVASGHLYERFMGIMMVSVMRHTKSPVKFWLIADFLSPSFKDFVPLLAEEYNFDFEFVTYKWPHWLRPQTEKQRTIWGYKILFLDVLFPLSLEKVIFVDADQVVRTDLKELMEMDLQGRVYAYTPFCESRTEMDGFRFWKTGYWAKHLGNKPYHISALYVIDLLRFRQLATGDRLRQSYQMLSVDPNSLANLDQDLPNNMQHQIPIFSLPQEWLWCETWCSDEELKTAKTIDLCNNPLTKEPKLDRARRILPEWEGIDNEIRDFAERVKNGTIDKARHEMLNKKASSSSDTNVENNERDEL